MASKTFVDFSNPAIDAAWLNDVNTITYVDGLRVNGSVVPQFPGISLGVAASPWAYPAIDFSATGSVWGSANGAFIGYNTYLDGGGTKAKTTNVGGLLAINSTGLVFLTAPSVATGSAQTFSSQFAVSLAGRTSSVVDAFTANFSANSSAGVNEATTYSVERFDTTSAFDPTTGRFTAPVTGLYHFDFAVQSNNGGGYVIGSLRINGSTTNITASAVSAGGVNVVSGAGGALQLTAGQYVSVYTSVGGGLATTVQSFSGHLITAT